MKLSYVGAGVALALALAGCGGKAQYTVQGTVAGLTNNGLVLANGSDTVSVPLGATSFTFPKTIDYGTEYNVTVQKQPDHMTCGLTRGGAGSAGQTIKILAEVACNQNTYTLGGQFSGIKPDSAGAARTITLLNGSTGGSVTITSTASGTGDFLFGTEVADGQAYGVTVVQPAPANGLSCTLDNGVGVMHEVNVSNLFLRCVEVPK